MIAKCSYCGKEFEKLTGEVTRAKKTGLNLYCDKICAGLGRRLNKTQKQLKEEKRLYDIEYRRKNTEKIRLNKQSYSQTEAGRATQKRARVKQKEYHNEYCRQPSYIKYKKEYDRKHRAKKKYGEYWESLILLQDISEYIDNREVKNQLGLINKSQKRKKDYEKFKCKKFKGNSLGNIE